MIRILSSLAAISASLAVQMTGAQAQLARTFVSAAGGNDANNCDRLTPCRTFQRAHDNTLAGGEITVLDPGGFGAVTIGKAISIINDGVGEAGVLVSGGVNGIAINAGVSDPVSLRGITVKGIGFGGGNGIVFTTGRSLTVENCVIRNLTTMGGTIGGFISGNGLVFLPNASSTLVVSHTYVTDNLSDGILVALAQGGSGTVAAALSDVTANNNGGTGLGLGSTVSSGAINVVASHSVFANNLYGILVDKLRSSPAVTVMLDGAIIAYNQTGIYNLGSLWIGGSIVTGNMHMALGSALSYGDNNIQGNGDGNPAPPLTTRR